VSTHTTVALLAAHHCGSGSPATEARLGGLGTKMPSSRTQQLARLQDGLVGHGLERRHLLCSRTTGPLAIGGIGRSGSPWQIG